MFKKFLSRFIRRKQCDSCDTQKASVPWPELSGQPRRVQPEQMARDVPFDTGTPHSRMHRLIGLGKSDGQIASELGLDVQEVRTYRAIIDARARGLARLRASAGGSSERVPAALLRQYQRTDRDE